MAPWPPWLRLCVKSATSKYFNLRTLYTEEMKKFEKYEHPHAVDFFSTLMNDILRHEFEVVVYINKGDEDCYYEECEEGSELHGRFEVRYKYK